MAFDRIARSRCSEPAWLSFLPACSLTGLPHRALDRRGPGCNKSHLQSGLAHPPVRHGCSSCQSAPRHCQTVFCEPGRCGPKSGAAKLVTGQGQQVRGEAGRPKKTEPQRPASVGSTVNQQQLRQQLSNSILRSPPENGVRLSY